MSKIEDYWVIRTVGQEYRVTADVALQCMVWYTSMEDANQCKWFEFKDLYDCKIFVSVKSIMTIYETTATQRDEEGEHLDFIHGQHHRTFE